MKDGEPWVLGEKVQLAVIQPDENVGAQSNLFISTMGND
jgi:hypothetical protein